MPKLSPTMTSAVLESWKISEGQTVKAYELLVDVVATSLTDDEDATGWKPLMEIEVQEDCVVHQILRRERESVLPGHPIAILVEEDDDLNSEEIQRQLEHAVRATGDIYLQNDLRMPGWQAYLTGEEVNGSQRRRKGKQ